MDPKEIKNRGQGKVFESPFLEVLSKAPPWLSAFVYLVLMAGILWVGYQNQVVDSFLAGAGIFLGAIFFWTFFEYFFHRYINHIDEYFPESKWAQRLAYTIHGIHHEYPRDKERLIMPPVPGLLIAGTLLLIYYLILGPYAYIFFPGFMTGYLLYTYVHYSTHRSNIPSFLKVQYRHHAIHHYKYPDKAFGVSTTLWDRVFGTMPPTDED